MSVGPLVLKFSTGEFSLAQSPGCDFTKYDSNILVCVPSKIEPELRTWEPKEFHGEVISQN